MPTIKLSLLTYNTWLIHSLAKNSDPPYKLERAKGFLTKFKDNIPELDLICLQELHRFGNIWPITLFDNSAYETLVDGLKEIINPHKYNMIESDTPYSGCLDSGLAIVSRFKVEKTVNYVFKNSTWRSYMTAKGVLYSKIRIPIEESSIPLHLFTLHMEAFDSEKRKLQVDELTSLVSKMVNSQSSRRCEQNTKDETELIIICGDFNIDSFSEPDSYSYLMEKLNGISDQFEFQDVFGSNPSNFPATFCDGSQCLDHILVSQSTKQRLSSFVKFKLENWTCRINNSIIPLSDHFGVKSVLEFNI